MPQEAPGAFNQALMDLGAGVCLPNSAPLCDSCPAATFCAAREQGCQRELPVRAPKKEKRREEKTVFLLLGPEGLLEVWRAVYALTGPLPYAVKPLVCRAGQPVALDALSDGWPAGATLLPVATKHRVRSLGYRLDLPRAGRFDPEKARALGVPVTQWRLLQRGQAVPLAERMVQPAEVLGAPRKGLRFVFSGDSAPCPALEQAAQGADLLLCDATYALPEQQEQAAQWGHSTFGQSAALAAKAGVKRLWLGGYSPMITDPEEHLAQAQSIFPAAECGFDGKRITLHYEENEE